MKRHIQVHVHTCAGVCVYMAMHENGEAHCSCAGGACMHAYRSANCTCTYIHTFAHAAQRKPAKRAAGGAGLQRARAEGAQRTVRSSPRAAPARRGSSHSASCQKGSCSRGAARRHTRAPAHAHAQPSQPHTPSPRAAQPTRRLAPSPQPLHPCSTRCTCTSLRTSTK